jgi:hypothetical protein
MTHMTAQMSIAAPEAIRLINQKLNRSGPPEVRTITKDLTLMGTWNLDSIHCVSFFNYA